MSEPSRRILVLKEKGLAEKSKTNMNIQASYGTAKSDDVQVVLILDESSPHLPARPP